MTSTAGLVQRVDEEGVDTYIDDPGPIRGPIRPIYWAGDNQPRLASQRRHHIETLRSEEQQLAPIRRESLPPAESNLRRDVYRGAAVHLLNKNPHRRGVATGVRDSPRRERRPAFPFRRDRHRGRWPSTTNGAGRSTQCERKGAGCHQRTTSRPTDPPGHFTSSRRCDHRGDHWPRGPASNTMV